MNQIDCILFDCDGTLVDSEVLCSKAYVHMFARYGIHLSLEEVFKKYKGVKLYEIIDRVNAEQGTDLAKETLEPLYRQEVARLFDSELQQIAGARELLAQVTVPVAALVEPAGEGPGNSSATSTVCDGSKSGSRSRCRV